jgi:sulfoxide reductase heme-binding subunit YedZ
MFDANRYPPPVEIMTEGFSGAFPGAATSMESGTHDPAQTSPPPADHGSSETATASPSHPGGASTSGAPTAGRGHGRAQTANTADMSAPDDAELLMRRYSTVTGYIATGLLALTLIIGPANLLLRKRAPLSSYLSRDVGIWAAVMSVLHVVFGLLTQHTDGILSYFVEPDDRSRILTTSFGWANWTGLAAVLIVAALAAISSDAALRRLKYRRWKRIQRLNYLLFVLVVMHALFYGALRRMTSPYTALLIVTAVAVGTAQAVGVRRWRQRRSRNRVAAAG